MPDRRLVARALIAARQRIAELEADKGRLDWLNANVTRQSAYPKTPACIHFSIDVHRGIETHDSKPGWAGYPSLGIREIIDDAIERGSENRTYCRDCEYGD